MISRASLSRTTKIPYSTAERARAAIAWPAVDRGRRSARRPCLSLPRGGCRTSRAGASRASLTGRPLPSAAPARLDGRRFGGVGTPPDLRYTAWAGGAATRRPLPWRCPLLNQWWRLRRGESRGDRLGNSSVGTRRWLLDPPLSSSPPPPPPRAVIRVRRAPAEWLRIGAGSETVQPGPRRQNLACSGASRTECGARWSKCVDGDSRTDGVSEEVVDGS